MNDPGDPRDRPWDIYTCPLDPIGDPAAPGGTRECQIEMECQESWECKQLQEEAAARAAARARARKAGGAERAETGDPRISRDFSK